MTQLRFLLPILPWSRRPAWQLRLGLTLYDGLTLRRGLPRHRRLISRHVHGIAPFLPGEADGAFTFFDAKIRSPERLALELAIEAERMGAFVANHTAVVAVLSDGGAITGVEVSRDGVREHIRAAGVINAAGPWVDAVNAVAGAGGGPLLGATRGTHIAVELGGMLPRDAVCGTAKSDGRVFFAVPQEHLLLIGTTDEHYEGNPEDVRPTKADLDYLLSEAQVLLPGLGIRADQVRYAYAGLRPLPYAPNGPSAAITRRHSVVDHGQSHGPRGLFSVLGGKLGTFRPLAREVVHVAAGGIATNPGTIGPNTAGDWVAAIRKSGLEPVSQDHLRVYGPAPPRSSKVTRRSPVGTRGQPRAKSRTWRRAKARRRSATSSCDAPGSRGPPAAEGVAMLESRRLQRESWGGQAVRRRGSSPRSGQTSAGSCQRGMTSKAFAPNLSASRSDADRSFLGREGAAPAAAAYVLALPVAAHLLALLPIACGADLQS